ncbi:MAG: formylglycine-generating enzyme family protein [Cytophagaceae bacterium]|nr:formylglycine-generating enzyme family protein [Cytophagaceae bacterium]
MNTSKQVRLGLVVGLCSLYACRTGPDEHTFAPGITIYSTQPEPPSAPASTPQPPLGGESTRGVSTRGMVYVPGGFTQIGAADGPEWEKPVFWAEIKPFFMDEHPVTVAEFRQFIGETKHQTEAEKFGDGAILDEKTKQWALKKGANWEYPQGEDQGKSSDNHPVTQVSWNDAQAYAKWAGKRLPYEFEWEHAARNAVNSRTRYPFGDEIQNASGTYLANVWNGVFPEKDAVADGFHLTSPVGNFGKTPLGLTDMTGNVWQWCQDWRQTYADVVAGQPPVDPTEKVQRGGSFLCEPGWCHGYRVSGRSFTSPETALMHVGFRCVKDLPARKP